MRPRDWFRLWMHAHQVFARRCALRAAWAIDAEREHASRETSSLTLLSVKHRASAHRRAAELFALRARECSRRAELALLREGAEVRL